MLTVGRMDDQMLNTLDTGSGLRGDSWMVTTTGPGRVHA